MKSDSSLLPENAQLQEALREANRCVACGLCVPKCPTYHARRSEAESPRGRLALIKGVLEGAVPVTERFAQHIDHCLRCGACESACPSGVRYGSVLDAVRPLVRSRPRRHSIGGVLGRSAVRHVVGEPNRLLAVARLVRWYQRSGMQRWVRRSRILNVLGLAAAEHALPEVPPVGRWAPLHGGRDGLGEVSLFLGCMSRALDPGTIDAAISVLTHLGYTVRIPSDQTCCGSLAFHEGQLDVAGRLVQRNVAAFQSTRGPVISLASGCGAFLQRPPGVIEPGADAPQVQDVSDFLCRAGGWDRVNFRSSRQTIFVHDPCTLRNAMGAASHVYDLLRHIPSLDVRPLDGNAFCCGAAGTYHLRHPHLAGSLRDDKMHALREALRVTGAPLTVVTSNIGCLTWLRQAAADDRLPVRLAHPVIVLAEAMGLRASPKSD